MAVEAVLRQRQRSKDRLELTLPFPPSVNTLYATVAGRRVLTKAGRDYKKTVAALVLEQNAAKGYRAPVKLTVILYPPDKRRRDLSNSLKCLEDALTDAGVYADDSLIDWLEVKRGLPSRAEGGSVSVTVELL